MPKNNQFNAYKFALSGNFSAFWPVIRPLWAHLFQQWLSGQVKIGQSQGNKRTPRVLVQAAIPYPLQSSRQRRKHSSLASPHASMSSPPTAPAIMAHSAITRTSTSASSHRPVMCGSSIFFGVAPDSCQGSCLLPNQNQE